MKSTNKTKKVTTVGTFAEKISRTKSVILVDYRGLTMSQLADLRAQLAAIDAEFIVTKNTLLQRALLKAGLTTDEIDGPTATVFAYGDEIAPFAVVSRFLKAANIGEAKFAYLNKESIDKTGILKLGNLPSRAELVAKLIGSLSNPLYGIVGVPKAKLSSLVYALSAIRDQKA